MSTTLNTMAPHRPIPAAPAIPSTLRAAHHRPGRNVTAVPAASTSRASTPPRREPPAGTYFETQRYSTTATAVARPTFVPPVSMVRTSVRSIVVGARVADMRYALLVRG